MAMKTSAEDINEMAMAAIKLVHTLEPVYNLKPDAHMAVLELEVALIHCGYGDQLKFLPINRDNNED